MGTPHIVRLAGGLVSGWSVFLLLAGREVPSPVIDSPVLFAACALGVLVGWLGAPYVTTVPLTWLMGWVVRTTADEVVAAGIGVLVALAAGALLTIPLWLLPGELPRILPIASTATLGYFAVLALTVHKDGIVQLLARGEAPRDADPVPGRDLLLDTSAIIDGRIADIARTGFLGGKLVIPRFVLADVHQIADAHDAIQRNRGRHALQVLASLRNEPSTPTEIIDVEGEDAAGVDAKLVRLARSLACPIVTTSPGLHEVAEGAGIQVLDVAALAMAVRSVVRQGDDIAIRIVQEGKDPDQGIGYLEDGTTVVVDAGRVVIGHTIMIRVTKVLQTEAGRMVFGRMSTKSGLARAS